ncbi:MAG: phosphoenolpyruvate carboxylase, partial [Bacteriovoracaceae bacterium]
MISKELKNLVSQTVKTLGLALKEVYGKELYQDIENIRLKMKKVRGANPEVVEKAMNEAYLNLHTRPEKDLQIIGKAFSLMLELINSSEAAFRTYRLKTYKTPQGIRPDAIIYVFTSHPTESRSAEYLHLMKQVDKLLLYALETNFENIKGQLLHLMRIAVRLHIANTKRPQVKDEMNQIFQIVLDEDILTEQINLSNQGMMVGFRTWVGGDKDGHPKVNFKTMIQSFEQSRRMILKFISNKLDFYNSELKLIKDTDSLQKKVIELKKLILSLRKVESGDGKKVRKFKVTFYKILSNSEKLLLQSPSILQIDALLSLYPALVLPLEIREDSGMIHKAVRNYKEPISQMLTLLKKVSQGENPKSYVRGFIISMCMSSDDYLAGINITERDLGHLGIPVIPLFENQEGLTHSIEILKKAIKAHPFIEVHKTLWDSRFEIMVGYSDSSKENGVLPSRLMVEESLFKLEAFIKSKKLTPVFFHGSGGSTSRGGGTVQEQISWWPQSALDIFKVTIQGEMVQRNFTNHLIMRSQAGKILESYDKVTPTPPEHPQEVHHFAQEIQDEYRKLINDEDFHHLTALATPYQYLDLLRIGSRPSKRSKTGEFSLRAIPWILCWTQTRLLLPFWWGTGSAWQSLTEKEKMRIKKDYKTS